MAKTVKKKSTKKVSTSKGTAKVNEMKEKKLYRSSKNRIIAGVCGGMGEYFNIDPTIVRLLWVLGTLITGFIPGIIAYIIAWAVMPER